MLPKIMFINIHIMQNIASIDWPPNSNTVIVIVVSKASDLFTIPLI